MNTYNMSTQTQEEVDFSTCLVDEQDLIVYNDDFNTFEHVIDSLIVVCDHSPIQAEQCTWIIHHNGKCQVRRGEFSALEPMCTALLDRGISANIE